ncbi:hypothetical protein HYX09_04605, partial [Candidatus Woesearchaeota archaeon]|nr:hypothetical protein [Candidatus Woesearchaeota archaeon]
MRQSTVQAQNQNERELPICKTVTATNCRIVEGVTESGKSGRPDGSFNDRQECSGEGTVALSSPMMPEDVGIVMPMGLMIGAHVTPIDHMYFSPREFHSKPDTYDVYADADG